MQGFWLGERKVGSQIIGDNQSRFPGRLSVGEIRRGGRRGRGASNRAKERVYRFWVKFGRDREEQFVCHASVLALAMTDEARQEAEM